MSQSVSTYLLERLMAWEVDDVFAYPGDGINGILGAWVMTKSLAGGDPDAWCPEDRHPAEGPGVRDDRQEPLMVERSPTRCGGYTDWLAIARMAATHRSPRRKVPSVPSATDRATG